MKGELAIGAFLCAMAVYVGVNAMVQIIPARVGDRLCVANPQETWPWDGWHLSDVCWPVMPGPLTK